MISEPAAEQQLQCPRCGMLGARVGISTKETIDCHYCGYHRTIAVTDQGVQVNEIEGCGGYTIKRKGPNTDTEIGSFCTPASELEFLEICDANKDQIESACYSVWDGAVLKQVTVI